MVKTKSRKWKRIKKRTPGGNLVTHYRKPKPNPAKCGECGKELNGVPRERQYRMKKIPKTKKRPQRPFGGVFCSNCTRKRMIIKARSI